MAARPLEIAVFALLASTTAVQLPSFLDPSATVTTTSAEAEASPPIDGGVLQILLPFVVMEALFAAAPLLLYRHHAAAAAGAGNRRRRLSEPELVAFISCVAVALLEHFLFVRPDGGALGLAALRALPASPAATFFLGVALVYAHLAGGNRLVQELAVRFLAKTTLDAAAALVGIMAVAVCTL